MEVGLGILGCGGGSARGCSDESTVVSKADSHEASSYAVEAELELGLGLSLGGGGGGGGGKGKSTSGGIWGESGRILTAKDFPSPQQQSHNAKPSSCAAVVISGTKRTAADSVSSHDHQGGGSPTPASQVVGWPPIRAYRMNSLVNQAKSARADHEDKSAIADQNEKSKDVTVKKKICNGNKTGATGNEKGPFGFVKVNMDGTPIGRKVDLNAHGCYETLAQALEEMFFKPSGTPTGNTIGGEKQQAKKHSKLLDGSSEFVLTYEDKEGDWMLVGDVPWRMFLSSVKRLRIMRTSEANGLAPRFQERSKPI